MDLVKIMLFGSANYSGVTYSEDRWIKQETFEKIKESIPTYINLGELDGKHSSVYGDVFVREGYTHETLLRLTSPEDIDEDGDELERVLWDLCYDVDIDYEAEKDEILKYLYNINSYVSLNVIIKREHIGTVNQFVRELNEGLKNG